MIKFDDAEQRVCGDKATGWIRVVRTHPCQEFYRVAHEVGDLQLRLEISAERLSTTGGVRVLIAEVHRYVADRQAWLPFRRSNDVLDGARRLLIAWAAKHFSVSPAAVGVIEAEREGHPGFDKVTGPPTAGTLKALVAEFGTRRRTK